MLHVDASAASAALATTIHVNGHTYANHMHSYMALTAQLAEAKLLGWRNRFLFLHKWWPQAIIQRDKDAQICAFVYKISVNTQNMIQARNSCSDFYTAHSQHAACSAAKNDSDTACQQSEQINFSQYQ